MSILVVRGRVKAAGLSAGESEHREPRELWLLILY